jgi:Mg-chelatase subunit ChlD
MRQQVLGWLIICFLAGCGPAKDLPSIDESCVNVIDIHEAKTAPPSVVQLSFRVTCESGQDVQAISGLAADDFTILESGDQISRHESSIELVPAASSFNLVSMILLDMSGSIVATGKVVDLQAAVLTLLDTLEDTQRVGIYLFDGREDLQVLSDFTWDMSAHKNAVESLSDYAVVDPSTNLNGAVQQGLEILDGWQENSGVRAFGGSLVVFTDGTDQAGYVNDSAVLGAVDASDHAVYTVGLGAEVDEQHLSQVGKTASFFASDVEQLESAFTDLADSIKNKAGGNYVLAYCSPKRAGEHLIQLRLNEGAVAVEFEFDATGFAPGCDTSSFVPAVVRTEPGCGFDDIQCYSLWGEKWLEPESLESHCHEAEHFLNLEVDYGAPARYYSGGCPVGALAACEVIVAEDDEHRGLDQTMYYYTGFLAATGMDAVGLNARDHCEYYQGDYSGMQSF